MHAGRLFGQRELREIGRQIRLEREAQGLTQTQVADAAGMSTRAVRDLEAGRSSPTLLTIIAVVDVLSLSLDELIAAARAKRPGPDLTVASAVGPGTTALTRDLANPRFRASIVDFSDSREPPAPPVGAVFGHVLAGSVGVVLDGEEIGLQPGDSLHARSGVLGEIRTAGTGTRVLLVETVGEGN